MSFKMGKRKESAKGNKIKDKDRIKALSMAMDDKNMLTEPYL